MTLIGTEVIQVIKQAWNAGCTLGTIPAPTVSGCTFAEFNYALKLLQSSQQAQRLAAVRQMATTRGHKEAQLGSAFTREEAAAGCADLDDEEDCAGETDSWAFIPCHYV